ncbi:hypothetical protein ACVWXO_003099 [Bradyrhizobium sp. LM2.7]
MGEPSDIPSHACVLILPFNFVCPVPDSRIAIDPLPAQSGIEGGVLLAPDMGMMPMLQRGRLGSMQMQAGK